MRFARFRLPIALLLAFAAACVGDATVGSGGAVERLADARSGESEAVMKLESAAFAADGSIPARHTCDGDDVSPPLRWSGVPSDAQSLALIVEDPDAPDPRNPQRVWVHWVVHDLPPDAGRLDEGASTRLPSGARDGRNDWNRTGWSGPCPPVGRHRYFHRLFALDTVLGDLGQPHKAALLKAMEGHVLAQAELVGTYERGGRR